MAVDLSGVAGGAQAAFGLTGNNLVPWTETANQTFASALKFAIVRFQLPARKVPLACHRSLPAATGAHVQILLQHDDRLLPLPLPHETQHY